MDSRRSPATARARGASYEALAERWLLDRGWSVLDRNFRDGPREIDRVVYRSGIVAFVEVKGTASVSAPDPVWAIDGKKRRDLERAARRWLHERWPELELGACSFRFDAVVVHRVRDGPPQVRHLPDGWRPGR